MIMMILVTAGDSHCRPTGCRTSPSSPRTDTSEPHHCPDRSSAREGDILTATERAIELTQAAAFAASDKLGTDIVAYDVSEQLAITDVFLVISATNERQVGAVVDAIEERLRTLDTKPVRGEGDRERRWVLLDFLDLVVHVQHVEERTFYALERLWHDCPQIELELGEVQR
jgi:ribosome-associated protein